MTRRRGRGARATLGVLGALALAVGAAGCGAAPPQVPSPHASTVERALAGIAQSCGESYQEHAFAASPAGIAALEDHARYRVRELARIYRLGPAWIYQGTTLRQLVALSYSYLRACRLPGAAALLERATR